ncbi:MULTISPECIES: hypothetical protein [Halobacteriovorax]|uniref:ATP-cone domain-containing protein n=1 Tax=Halobacteriovorax vibrionivorans TaxID=2152716 RepID=A0ABY0IJ25_9BACT|nr:MULTISPECIES: hypothetical protein [Halobacteriovorax]AYF45926.1 hypothetical protein BALOs_2943 [Halobacteriovorax sp. BALOs_7]RZF22961.1 hypothetical protein DAY19_04090 [Halobacteriovorax vibrionivorans]TGD46896.1 hypothetical protein EP118_10350 [Halobacteriovorax sp. Y22]
MHNNQESIQLINTAIIKGKERKIDTTYEDRLSQACNSSAIAAISNAIEQLAETDRISYDQAAIKIVETIKELDQVWTDYVLMEGINNIKKMLKGNTKH